MAYRCKSEMEATGNHGNPSNLAASPSKQEQRKLRQRDLARERRLQVRGNPQRYEDCKRYDRIRKQQARFEQKALLERNPDLLGQSRKKSKEAMQRYRAKKAVNA